MITPVAVMDVVEVIVEVKIAAGEFGVFDMTGAAKAASEWTNENKASKRKRASKTGIDSFIDLRYSGYFLGESKS